MGVPVELSSTVGNDVAIPAERSIVLCRKRHKMAKTQCTVDPNTLFLCPCCRTKIRVGEYYYVCEACECERWKHHQKWHVMACKRCVAAGHQRLKGRWSTGLFDCHKDVNSCMDGLLCMYCFHLTLYGNCDKPSCSIFFLAFFHFILDAGLVFLDGGAIESRIMAANFYETNEACCELCCIAYFCRPCSNCQVHREMTLRGHFPGGFACWNQRPNQALLAAVSVPIRTAMEGRKN